MQKLNSMLVVALILCSAMIARAQGVPEAGVRLSNPQFDKESRIYTLDVELQSNADDQQLFGMNMRFFYDAAKLKFLDFRNMAAGYGILGKQPRAFTGNSSSGLYLFNLEQEVAYVNAAVQLMEESTSLMVSRGGWTKFFQIGFEVPKHIVDAGGAFFPSVILDTKGDARGGFFKGEDGVLITFVEHDPLTPMVSKPTITRLAEHFNWEYHGYQEYPFGQPVEETGINFFHNLATNLAKPEVVRGFKVFQNFPNPFIDESTIGFVLPAESAVALRLYDITGRELKKIEGQFSAGNNQITLTRQDLPESSDVLLYRLETPEHSSAFMKMTIINH